MTRKLPPVDVVLVGFGWTAAIMGQELTEAGLSVLAIERGGWRDTSTDFAVSLAQNELRYYWRRALFQEPARETGDLLFALRQARPERNDIFPLHWWQSAASSDFRYRRAGAPASSDIAALRWSGSCSLLQPFLGFLLARFFWVSPAWTMIASTVIVVACVAEAKHFRLIAYNHRAAKPPPISACCC